jgi:hypothetical protein
VLLDEELRDITLYSGVSESDFVDFMRKAIVRAKELESHNKRLWIFFDEFNTSCLQSIIAEIMLDRVCPIDSQIYRIPDNIVFISCCNPYRMKTKKADVGLVPKTKDNLLSHRVYPIPERLINFIWDFGQLSDKDEYKHLLSIIENAQIIPPSDIRGLRAFCNMIYTAHKYVRDIEERSGVSLRDIKRVLTIYNWFRDTLKFYELEIQGKKTENKDQIHITASVAAVMVCYGLRLNGRPEQKEFIRKFLNSVKEACSLWTVNTSFVKNALSKIAEDHFQKLIELNCGIIPDGIALNAPLKENFITMLACFDTLTPLIICGAPGTSKTLCTQIFNSALTPNVISKCGIFRRYKGINAMYYGGSQTSTSEGISKVFDRGEKYLENKGEDRPVVVFDEIGLAELSPYNPLKILHPLLERVDVEVGFLGLSNWTLDLSKMNRLIYVARPDMTKDDLNEIFRISIEKCPNEKIKTDLQTFLQHLTTAYLNFRDWQKKHGSHPNFHGSRDIYGVSKFIYQNMLQVKHYDTSAKIRELIKTAIERNFNGAIYLFSDGDRRGMISDDTIPNLHEGFAEKNLLGLIRVKELGDPYDKDADKFDDNIRATRSGRLMVDERIFTIYSSTEVFKKLFLNEILKESNSSLFTKEFQSEFSVLDLIDQNINDKTARFLLVKSEGEVVDNIFLEKLREFNKTDKIIDWRGIKGKENSLDLLSTMKSYISLGYVVVMKNLDELYGSLYDLFNQKYMEVDGRQYCYLYYGENKHRVEVHPDFKAIVILSAEKELEGLDVELEQPAPFLNRFEKFFLRISNILPESKVEELIKLRNFIKTCVKGYSSRVVGLSIDMVASMCVKKSDVSSIQVGANPGKGGRMDAEFSPAKPTHNQSQCLMKLSTLNYLLYDKITQDDITAFLAEHPYSTLKEAMSDLVSRGAYKLCLMTFSNPMELEPVRESIRQQFNVNIISSEDIFALGLEKRSFLIKNYKESTIVIQFVYAEHLTMISQMKSTIEQNSKISRVLFLIHLERDPRKRDILRSNIGVNYWNDWDTRVLDNIQMTRYQEYCQIRSLTFEDLILTEYYETGINLFSEACLLCIVKIAHESGEDFSLKMNMFNIRNLIEKDPTFIDAVREKIKAANIFGGNSETWIEIINNRTKHRDYYVDLDTELLTYFKEKYSEKMKRYLKKLNNDLNNIASYSLGFLSAEEDVKEYFKQTLKTSIEQSDLNEIKVFQALKSNQASHFYRLPFLSDIYAKLSDARSKMYAQNKMEFERLSKYIYNYKLATLHNVPEEQIKPIREKITKGEQYLTKALSLMIKQILEEISARLKGLLTRRSIKANLIMDLMLISLAKVKIQKTDDILDNYRFVCAMLNKNAFDDPENLFITSSILVHSLEQQTMFVFEIMAISNFNATEIDNFRKNLKQVESDFQFNYSNIDLFVNFCQEKLIPEFDDKNLNLKLYKDKYEMVIDRIKSDQQNINENDPNIYNFRSLINLFSMLSILPEQKKLNYLARLKDIKNQKQRFGSSSSLDFVKEQILYIFIESREIRSINNSEYCLVLSEYIFNNAVMLNFDLFTESKYDPIFERFNKEDLEKISCTLGQVMASRIPEFYSMMDLKKTLEEVKSNHTLQAYNSMLNKIDLFKKRNLYFAVSLIDNLFIKGSSSTRSSDNQRVPAAT